MSRCAECGWRPGWGAPTPLCQECWEGRHGKESGNICVRCGCRIPSVTELNSVLCQECWESAQVECKNPKLPPCGHGECSEQGCIIDDGREARAYEKGGPAMVQEAYERGFKAGRKDGIDKSIEALRAGLRTCFDLREAIQ